MKFAAFSRTAVSARNSTRNYGIDLLRIISMIMVPMLHVLGHGGVLHSAEIFSVNYETAWFLEIASYCAVNCYAMISGYVGYGKKQRCSNLFYLILQALFYTVFTTAVVFVIKPEFVGISTIIKAIFPFAYTYWYLSAYFCLFFVMPLLNRLVDKSSKTELLRVILILLFIFSVLPTIFYSDYGSTSYGYSFLWLAILYIIGAYFKKYGVLFPYSNQLNLLGYFVCVILTWLSKLVIELLTSTALGSARGGDYLISYTSPLIVLCAVFLLLFCANFNCGRLLTKSITFFAPMTFGVYLFHEEPLIREIFMRERFVAYAALNPFLMITAVLGTAVMIWLIGSFIDKCRLILFQWLKVRQFCDLLEKRVRKIWQSFTQFIFSKWHIVN